MRLAIFFKQRCDENSIRVRVAAGPEATEGRIFNGDTMNNAVRGCRWVFILLPLLFLCSTVCLVQSSIAEVSSKPCPFSCSSAGIPKQHCKDWKEGQTCFVDDLRIKQPGPFVSDAELDRKIKSVEKTLLSGRLWKLGLENRAISRVDIVARKAGGGPAAEVSLSIGDSVEIGQRQRVEQSQNQVFGFNAEAMEPHGRKLHIQVDRGDVFLESIHVLYLKTR